MRFYCICDARDTCDGMRLAGIEGQVLFDKEKIEDRLKELADDENIGVILMSGRLISLCQELVFDIKLNRRRPLIVEIPDRHGTHHIGDTISQYIRQAVGIVI